MDKKKLARSATRKQNQIPGFLRKTFAILDNPEFKDIITWSQDGKSFVVLKPNDFSEKVLPKYFKHNKFASFVRQLNMYDFHKLKHDTDDNEWSHHLFKRGSPQLLQDIKRKITENPQQENQVVAKREVDQAPLYQEVGQLKSQYDNIEKICTVLLMQNQQLFVENAQLKSEFQKSQDKQKQLAETIFSIVLYQLGPTKFKEIKNILKQNDIVSAVDYDQSYTNQSSLNLKDSQQNSGALQTMEQWKKKDLGKIIKKFLKINKTKKMPNKKLSHPESQLEIIQQTSPHLINNIQSTQSILTEKPILDILKDSNGCDLIQDIYQKSKKKKLNQSNSSDGVEQDETKSQISKISEKSGQKNEQASTQLQPFYHATHQSHGNNGKQPLLMISNDQPDHISSKSLDIKDQFKLLPQSANNPIISAPSNHSIRDDQDNVFQNTLQSPFIPYGTPGPQFDLHPSGLLRGPSIFEPLSPKIGGLNNNMSIEQMSDYFQIDDKQEDAKSQL